MKKKYIITSALCIISLILIFIIINRDSQRNDGGEVLSTPLGEIYIPKEEIPVIRINTLSGEPVLSKEYEQATIEISDAPKRVFNISRDINIRGRGNSSWSDEAEQNDYNSKNSYRIHFDSPVNLLGIGKGPSKNWVLNSNKFDISSMRNYLIWTLAGKMNTFSFVPDCTWVYLYINNSFRGLYMVTEQIEVSDNRIKFDPATDPEQKGYLIEIDYRGHSGEEFYFYVDGYGIPYTESAALAREFVVKNAESQSEVNYISDYVTDCHKAIMTGEEEAVGDLVDIPSLIDMYILSELSKEVDAGATSFYLRKEPGKGKLFFDAPWDYDFGFGTYGANSTPEGLFSTEGEGCIWFETLCKEEWFRAKVCTRLLELEQAVLDTLEEVLTQSFILSSPSDVNDQLWKVYGNWYHGYVNYKVSADLHDYNEHVSFLLDWTFERYNWLISYFR